MKRVIDIVGATVGLAFASPLLAVAAIAIVAESGFPVLFRQTRTGLDGAEFEMLKLRTMVGNASQIGPLATAAGDPRITRVGRVLRRTSLDELPQLVNVLRGEMSLVGPRPDLPSQRADYDPVDWQKRCSVRPGITGLAQTEGRSTITFEERLQLDLRYVEERSVLLDLRTLARTAGGLTRGDGN